MVAALRNDVRRTEAFARLSRPNGADAASTLLLENGFWWEDPLEALSRMRSEGCRSWTLFLVSVLKIFAISMKNPLSAGVFLLQDA